MYICIYKPKLFKIYVFYCFLIVVCSSKSKEIYIKKTNENFKKYKKITIKKQMFQIFFRYMLNSFKINIYIYIYCIYIYIYICFFIFWMLFDGLILFFKCFKWFLSLSLFFFEFQLFMSIYFYLHIYILIFLIISIVN